MNGYIHLMLVCTNSGVVLLLFTFPGGEGGPHVRVVDEGKRRGINVRTHSERVITSSNHPKSFRHCAIYLNKHQQSFR